MGKILKPFKWASPGFEPGPPAPKAGIIPLDHEALAMLMQNTNILEIFVIYLNLFYYEIYIHGN